VYVCSLCVGTLPVCSYGVVTLTVGICCVCAAWAHAVCELLGHILLGEMDLVLCRLGAWEAQLCCSKRISLGS